MLTQGKGHTRVKESEEEFTIPKIDNSSHCSEDNGCEKYDSGDKQDASVDEEPSVDGILASDDNRPVKKAKSDDDAQRKPSNDINNGCYWTMLLTVSEIKKSIF